MIQNLVIEQGTTFSWGFAVTYNGAPLGTGWTATSEIRADPTTTEPVLYSFTCTIVDNVVVNGINSSVVTIAAAPADSTAWTFTKAAYDVKITDSQTPPTVLRVAQGTITVSPQVTV